MNREIEPDFMASFDALGSYHAFLGVYFRKESKEGIQDFQVMSVKGRVLTLQANPDSPKIKCPWQVAEGSRPEIAVVLAYLGFACEAKIATYATLENIVKWVGLGGHYVQVVPHKPGPVGLKKIT